MRLFLRSFLRAFPAFKRQFFFYVPSVFFLSAIWVLEPLYARHAIDALMSMLDGKQVNIFMIVGGWFGIFMVQNILQGINSYFKWDVQNRLLARSREIYYEHILRLDISHHVKAKTGELMKVLDNASDATVDLTRQTIMELPTSFLTSIVFYIISFMISWQLALLSLMLLPIYFLIVSATVRYTRKNIDKVNRLWVTSLGRGYDAIANIFTVKSSAGEIREVSHMADIHQEGLNELKRANLIWAALEGFGYFSLMRITMTVFGIWLLVKGQISLGSLFFFQFSYFRLVVPMEMLSNMMPRWNEYIGKIRLAEDLYKQEITIRSPSDAKTIKDIRGHMEFKNIGFAYGDSETIRSLSLDVQPGEHIAFVGHSGAGKSTMAMLINRFYDVHEGAILVDGVDLRELDVHWWRTQIGLVLQENIMFNDTIMENIRYSRPDATREDVIKAATRASASDFIEKLPNGYDSLVGERGIKLSGGERQRVAIARAILKKPTIVVLDEATSALDSITEKHVQEGIAELMKGRTSFIIAHRLSTVRQVDRIAVLEEGKVTAFAPHDELMKISPVYRQMVELQREGMLAE